MISQKLKKQDFRFFILFLVLLIGILFSCDGISKKVSPVKSDESNSAEWYKGRRLFIDNHCAACHLVVKKEKEFSSFILRLNSDKLKSNISELKNILIDSNHLDIKKDVDVLSETEYELLLEYLKTPRKQKVLQ